MLKADKERIVEELTERLKTTPTLFVADYRGLSVTEIDELRTKVIEHGARFTVVKNTLTKRAAEAAGADALLAMLEGPTAIAFIEADGDMVAVAKALSDAARTTRVLSIRGGILDGKSDRRSGGSEPRDAAPGRRAPRPDAGRDHGAADDRRRPDQRSGARPDRPDRRPHRAAVRGSDPRKGLTLQEAPSRRKRPRGRAAEAAPEETEPEAEAPPAEEDPETSAEEPVEAESPRNEEEE